MADDTVDNEHPSFVIIENDTVNNEHPRVNAGTLGDEAEDQPTNGSTVGSKKDVDSKDDIGRETDAHGQHKTDETDDGANIEDKNSAIDIKGEDNQVNAGTLGDEAEGQPTNASIVGSKKDVDNKDDIGETAEPGQTVETDDGTNTEDKNSAIDIKKEGNRSANESVSLDQCNVQQLDNNSVKPEEKKDANTELREDDNIGVNAGTLGDEAEGQPTNGSNVGSKNDVDNKDVFWETDEPGHQQTVETDDGTNKESQHSEIDIKEKGNRSANKSVPLDQGNGQLSDNNYDKTEEKTDANTEPCEVDNMGKPGSSLSGSARIHIDDDGHEVSSEQDNNRETGGSLSGQARIHIVDDRHDVSSEQDNSSENDCIRPDQAKVQPSDDKNDDGSKGETSFHTKACSNNDIGPNDIPKETGSVDQMVDYTEEKQGLEIHDLKEGLLHSEKGTENCNIQKLQNDVKSLRHQLEESVSTVQAIGKKDMSNQEEIYRLKELNSDLQTRNCRIENELVQMKEENQRLKNDMEKEAEKHKKEKDQVNKKMVEKDKEIEKSKTIIRKQKDEISKIGGLESQITKKDKEIEKAKKEIEKQKNEISKIKRENEKQLAKMNQQTDRLNREIEEKNQQTDRLNREIQKQKNQLQSLVCSFKQEKEGYHQQVQVLKAEKTDLLLRLSKVASANMTYNNPNIADLSDEKRPTKLAEDFSELYDNEWTDAFEEIEGENEKDKLTFILELLKRANQLCMDLSNEHTRKVKQSISSLKILIPNKQEQNRTDGSSDKDKLRQSEKEQNLPESNEQEKRNQNGDDGRRKVSEERQDTLTEEARSPDKSQKESQSNGDEGRENWTKEEKDKLTKESCSSGTSQNGSESSGDEGKEKLTKEGQDTMTEEAHSSGKGQNGSGSNGDEGREEGREEGQDTLTEKARSSDKKQHGSESDGKEENNLNITKTDETEDTASAEKQNNTHVENDNENRNENDKDLDEDDADENNPCTTHTEKAEVTSSSEKPNRPRMENENAKKHENNLDEDDTEEKNLDTTQTAGAEDTLRTEGDPHIDDMQDEKSPDQTPLQGSELIDTQTAEEKQQAKKEKQPKPSGTCEAESSTNTEGDPHINDMQDEKSADQTSLQGSELIEAQTAEEKQQAKKEKQPKPSETCEAESSTNTEGDPHIDDMQDEKPADQTASQESELIDTQISPEGDDVQQQLSKGRASMESKEHTKDDGTSDTCTPKNEGNLPTERDDHLKKKKIQATEVSQSLTEGECLAEQGDMSSESQVADRNDIILQPKPKKKRLESDFEKLQTEQKKTILEATKFFETLLSENVKNAVKEIIVNEKGIDDEKQKCVVVYIEKCIDLCWSMLRHKPPVHVDLPDIISDTPFDTNKYKPYTKTGKHLAYLVWPALYLHEGGPLLSKGVAQGK